MPTRSMLTRVVASLVWVLLLAASAAAVSIETVPVGYAGNAADVDYGEGQFGAVAYDYRIGKYEVTNAQFVEYLNAKVGAVNVPGGIGYAPTIMGPSSLRGGILRTGVAPNYSYSVLPDFANKPVIGTSWLTAIRFANWMHNGQGNGDTETGAYTIPPDLTSQFTIIPRNPGARWFLPNEDEWYKAAYYQPAAQGGDADDYWLYPTRSNDLPTLATADPAGNISNPGGNVANYQQGADWNTQNGNVTTVGSAGPASASFFGTYDQAGNVREWTEGLHPLFADSNVSRGGSWVDSSLAASVQRYGGQASVEQWYGFRLATVPEPSTYVLAALGFAAVLLARRRTRRSLSL
jgi:formylglycine-generating enzyme